MKTTNPLVPLALIAIAAIWLSSQRRTLADLEARVNRFETHLAKSNPDSSLQPQFREIKTALDGQPVNWMLVARELANNQGGYGIFKANRRIEEQLASLSASELIAALEAAADLPEDERSILESNIVSLLCEKDPAYLLQQAQDDDKRSRWQGSLPRALTNWTKNSPTDALGWFDSLPENSVFEPQLPDFRTSIFNALLVVDAPLAQERFLALSDSQKFSYVHDFNFGAYWKTGEVQKPGMLKNIADLLRLLPKTKNSPLSGPLTETGESERSPALFQIQKSLAGWETRSNGNLPLESLKDYFHKIEASPAEVSLCLDALLSYGRMDLTGQPERTPEELRAWLESEIQLPTKR